MKFGIIGAGFIGRGLATLALKAGHDVMVSDSRGRESLISTAVAVGCKVGSAQEAAEFGEVVLVAIPLKHYQSIPAAPLARKIVVDANNYYPQRDGNIAALDTNATTISELLARHLGNAKVVKAFNAILPGDLERDGRPAGARAGAPRSSQAMVRARSAS